MNIIQQQLFDYQDVDYRKFVIRHNPTVEENTIIGIRLPILRKLAKSLYKEHTATCMQFLEELPHTYFEENMLHAFIICQINNLDNVLQLTEAFLPYVDNWAVCDSFHPPIFGKYADNPSLQEAITTWLNSDHPYIIRYAIVLRLTYYLTDYFDKSHLQQIANIQSDHYYVKMAIAWYFSMALAKQYDATIPLFETPHLELWTHNKALQKAIESRQITTDTKDYLRTLKIK